MIKKLDWTQSKVQQNIEQLQNPTSGVIQLTITLLPIIKRMVLTLMYCNRLHAWWVTQSRLTLK